MSEKTTKSNDGSMELKIENLDPASQAVLAKMNGYDFEVNAVGFQPETLDKELSPDEIMEGMATDQDTKIEVVKHIKVRFKQFINYILNGLIISLKGKAKESAKTKKEKTNSSVAKTKTSSKVAKTKVAKPKENNNDKEI